MSGPRLEFLIPTDARPKACRACGRLIYFGTNDAGKPIPLEPLPERPDHGILHHVNCKRWRPKAKPKPARSARDIMGPLFEDVVDM